jgi:hypothetical protein
VLGRQTIAELRRWCADTDSLLTTAQPGVAEQTAQVILRRASALAGLKEVRTSIEGLAEAPAAAPAPRPGEALRPDIVRIAGRLQPGVTAQEREAVARAAERVLTADSRSEALGRLGDLRVRVKDASAAAQGRRGQAVEASRLLQPLAHAGESAQPLRADLLQVVAGAAPLTPELRDRARQAAAELEQAADRTYLRDSVTGALAELGYAVDEGFQTAVPRNGVLQVTRGEWGDEHGVRLALDAVDSRNGKLVAVVVRTKENSGWDATRKDTQREAQWCADLEKLAKLLEARNVTMELGDRPEPGTRRVRVVPGGSGRAGSTAPPSTATRIPPQ